MPYYNREPKALSSILKDYIRDFPHRKKLKKGMILSLWAETVGSAVANQCHNLHFEGDRLIVHVKNPVWRHELHVQRYSIIQKLNQSVREQIIKEIIVRS